MTDKDITALKDIAPEIGEVVALIDGDAAHMTEALMGVHNKLKDLVERVRVKRDLALHHVNEFRDLRNEVAACATDMTRVLDAVGSNTQLPQSKNVAEG